MPSSRPWSPISSTRSPGDDPGDLPDRRRRPRRALPPPRALRLSRRVRRPAARSRRLSRRAVGRLADEALATRRLAGLEGEALLRAGVGFSEGLEEAVEHLSRAVVELAATDPATGLTNGAKSGRRLAVELERCRRTEVGLGALPRGHRHRRREHRGVADRSSWARRPRGALLAAGLRRYDVVGRLSDHEFVAVLPDVSRRGVQAGSERLRRGLAGECPPRRSSFPLRGDLPRRRRHGRDDLMAQLAGAWTERAASSARRSSGSRVRPPGPASGSVSSARALRTTWRSFGYVMRSRARSTANQRASATSWSWLRVSPRHEAHEEEVDDLVDAHLIFA